MRRLFASSSILRLIRPPCALLRVPSSIRLLETLAKDLCKTASSRSAAEDQENLARREDLDIFQKSENKGITAADGFTLRPYQEDCVRACLDALHGGINRMGISSPTGSGKTAIFTSLIQWLPKLKNPQTKLIADKVLVLVGSIELVKQAAATIRIRHPELVVEIEQGMNNIANGKADVTVATYQTLSRVARSIKFDTNDFKAVIVDEAHHSSAKSYISILSQFDSRIQSQEIKSNELESLPVKRVIESKDAAPSISKVSFDHYPTVIDTVIDSDGLVCVPIIGFTATFRRSDELALGKVYEEIIWHADWMDMIDAGWLAKLRFTTVQLGAELNLAGVSHSSSTKDFSKPELSERIDTRTINGIIVDAYLDKAENRKSTLIFAVDIKHVVNLTNAFREAGIDARPIHSRMPTAERVEVLSAFRQGKFPVLVNCSILTEGADIPCIDCIILARPTKSQNLFIQMLGRGLRLSPGKEDCLLIDMVGNIENGLFSSATLFGIDPTIPIEGRSISSLKQLSIDSPLHPPEELASPALSVAYKDFTSVWNLIATQKQNQKQLTLKQMSRFAWVGVGDMFILSDLKTGNHIKVQVIPDSMPPVYEAISVARITSGYFTSPTRLFQHSELDRIFTLVDAWISRFEQLNFSERGIWQYKPASEPQKTFIRSKLIIQKRETYQFDPFGAAVIDEAPEEVSDLIDGGWIGKELGNLVSIEELTRGEAAEVATRIIHGGKSVFTKAKKAMMKEEKRLEKLEKLIAKQKRK